MTKVKICGLQTPEAVQAAVAAGADYLGFVFAPSRRQISIAKAKELVKGLPASVKTVGVFVNPSLDSLKEHILAVPLDMVQIHGDWDESMVEALDVPVIGAIQVAGGLTPPSEKLPYVLFDAPQAGSGKTFDWQAVDLTQISQPVFIAGGLTVANVQEAIATFSPYAVDVSSGVETAGEKDVTKIKTFIERVKA
ncbi:phosphoribosylanthranilate isomerase [Streptococcus sp. DD12]|uniref:phosphoribosylanthranilate isomerase n=1 Tax=Streptococcus sp. DD12 TaxID=1777880 RepID=UPI000794E277|nr:phosphoribosylanthranilate isomerase [Streptococcus sp. DD12]KXT76702.1 Phosphoribosylanthranilate isomerase [Streptococcus sp. DD12]